MLILGIETASRTSSVALSDGERVIAALTVESGLDHSATLLENIAALLTAANKNRRDLTGIAVSIGPGSFTGLRIGLAAAKSIAYGLKLPLAAVPTLKAMAARYRAIPSVIVAALADAQKKNAYCGFFAGGEEISPVSVRPLEAVLIECADFIAAGRAAAVVICGDIAAKKLVNRADLPRGVCVAPREGIMPRADEIAMLGAKMIAAGETADAMTCEPWYLRRSEAEELWEKRHPQAAEQ